jgi:hypothetical protein
LEKARAIYVPTIIFFTMASKVPKYPIRGKGNHTPFAWRVWLDGSQMTAEILMIFIHPN